MTPSGELIPSSITGAGIATALLLPSPFVKGGGELRIGVLELSYGSYLWWFTGAWLTGRAAVSCCTPCVWHCWQAGLGVLQEPHPKEMPRLNIPSVKTLC